LIGASIDATAAMDAVVQGVAADDLTARDATQVAVVIQPSRAR
jgi:hypothetical protein